MEVKRRRRSFWDTFSGCPENITVPQHSLGHLWAKGKSAASKKPGSVLWIKREQWRAGSPERKRDLLLRLYAQNNAKKMIG